MSRGICFHPVRWISGRRHGQRQKYLHAGSHRYFLVQVRRSTSEVEVQGHGRKKTPLKWSVRPRTRAFQCCDAISERSQNELECGPMPNVMAALPNIGGALCSTPQSLADAHNCMLCSNAAKTRKPLKVAGVPQTPETTSATSGP